MDIKKYLTEVRSEISKVNWPTKEKTMKDSAIVIAASLATAAFLGGADYLFSQLAQKVIMK